MKDKYVRILSNITLNNTLHFKSPQLRLIFPISFNLYSSSLP